MGNTSGKGLITGLRSRISDDRAAVASFSLRVTGEAKSALLEITNGFFSVTVEGGEKAKSIRFGLSLPTYSTVARLVAELTKQAGYEVEITPGYQLEHPSSDLRLDDGGIKDISAKSETLYHYIFSDAELVGFLNEAIDIHNPNYSINTVPEAEHPYVLMKAQARAYRVQAIDAAKRRGLDTDAKVFIALAKDLEDQYDRDTRRRARIIPSPKIDESRIHSGDAIQGALSRRSLRAGYTSSYRNALPPEPPTLLDPADDDVEDVLVRLRWKQDRDQSFSYYELWRDTVPEVDRSIQGRLTQQSAGTPVLPVGTQYSRPGTAKQVLGLAVGANRVSPVFDGFFFWTAAELAGSNIVNTSFVDGVVHPNPGAGVLSILGDPLEPEMEYYYRLYTINWNGEVLPSNVLRVKTKVVRARFARDANGNLDPNAIAPVMGVLAGGISITINGTNIVAGTKIFLGGKVCTEVSRTSTQIVVTSPAFTNADFIGKYVDLVMISPTRLKDIAISGWKFT